MDLKVAIQAAAQQLALTDTSDELCVQVLTYVTERLKSWYRDDGITPEVFASVAALGLSNPLDIDSRVKAVDQFSRAPEAVALASANKRVLNILAKQDDSSLAAKVDPSLFEDSAETQLAADIERLSQLIAPLVSERDYIGVLAALATLREPVDVFFDGVMVMADDLQIRANRLALLHSLRQLFLNVADISHLVVSK